jgi:hypothetical protein
MKQECFRSANRQTATDSSSNAGKMKCIGFTEIFKGETSKEVGT